MRLILLATTVFITACSPTPEYSINLDSGVIEGNGMTIKTTIDSESITHATAEGLQTIYPSENRMTIKSECLMFDATYSDCGSNMMKSHPERTVKEIHDVCVVIAADDTEIYGCN